MRQVVRWMKIGQSGSLVRHRLVRNPTIEGFENQTRRLMLFPRKVPEDLPYSGYKEVSSPKYLKELYGNANPQPE